MQNSLLALSLQADERRVPISLETWAKWLLSHRLRRFARHPTFMYLLYDVIQRRKSALGNPLLFKRRDYEHVQDVISSLSHGQNPPDPGQRGSCGDEHIVP